MITCNIQEARNKLSQLIARAVAGEEVIIAKAGKPIARLIPYTAKTKPRRLGVWKGRLRIAADFDGLPGSLQAAFRGAANEAAWVLVTRAPQNSD